MQFIPTITKLENNDYEFITCDNKKTIIGELDDIMYSIDEILNEIHIALELIVQVYDFDEVKYPIITEYMKSIIHKAVPIFEGVEKITMPTIIIKEICKEYIPNICLKKLEYNNYKTFLTNFINKKDT